VTATALDPRGSAETYHYPPKHPAPPALHCTVLCCTLHCTTLYCTAQSVCTVLYEHRAYLMRCW